MTHQQQLGGVAVVLLALPKPVVAPTIIVQICDTRDLYKRTYVQLCPCYRTVLFC